MPDNILNTLCWLLGIVIAVAGTLLALRALAGWRPPKARRCPRCWYDLSTITTPTSAAPATCPECARAITSERALTRRRRSRRVVLLGLIMALAGRTLWAVPDARQHGWPRLIPATAIALAAPALAPAWLDGPWWRRGPVARRAAAVTQDFLNRDNDDRLWSWQSSLFARLTDLGMRLRSRADAGPDRDALDRLDAARLSGDFVATAKDLYGVVEAASGVPIEPDPTLPSAGDAPRTQIRWRSFPARTAVAMISANDFTEYLSWRMHQGVLIDNPVDGSSAAGDVTRVGVFSTADIPLDRPALNGVITTVAPDQWVDHGGDAAAIYFSGSWAIVDAPPDVLWRIDRLLSELRAGAQRGPASPPQVAGARRTLQALAGVPSQVRPVPRIVPLADTLAAAGVNVSLDSAAHFADQGERDTDAIPERTTPAAPANPSAIDALNAIVDAPNTGPTDIGWELVDDGVVIADKSLRPSLTVSLAYDITDVITPARGTPLIATPKALFNRIAQEIDPDHWRANGGELGWLSTSDRLLIVHTTLRNHVAIDDLLTSIRSAQPAK